ncbi:MAG: LuxR C-terminal-related transcriptional regulator [bacterium]|nr:LuxR C-terminal-related transcriptional regulator [bacterium]
MRGEPTPLVFVVDDDPSMRRSLARLLSSAGIEARIFAAAGEFLACERPDCPACLLLDVKLGGKSGLDLQDEMARRGIALPIIFISGHGTVPTSVRAMKAGAADFLEKPFDRAALLAAVRQAFEEDSRARRERAAADEVARRIASLTPRERQVLELVVAGKPNKQIAADLGIAEKTVKVHRARVMEKMRASSLAELVRLSP